MLLAGVGEEDFVCELKLISWVRVVVRQGDNQDIVGVVQYFEVHFQIRKLVEVPHFLDGCAPRRLVLDVECLPAVVLVKAEERHGLLTVARRQCAAGYVVADFYALRRGHLVPDQLHHQAHLVLYGRVFIREVCRLCCERNEGQDCGHDYCKYNQRYNQLQQRNAAVPL